jgi:signal peptidase II
MVSVAFVVVVIDQFVKELVLVLLEPGRFVPLLGSGVGWQLIFNPGAAFGLRLPPIVFPVVMLALAVFMLRSVREPGPIGAVLAQGLILGGAVGNVVDRIFRPGAEGLFGGYVVDFVAWGSFPRFNVADASITVGVTLFILISLMQDVAARRHRTADA